MRHGRWCHPPNGSVGLLLGNVRGAGWWTQAGSSTRPSAGARCAMPTASSWCAATCGPQVSGCWAWLGIRVTQVQRYDPRVR